MDPDAARARMIEKANQVLALVDNAHAHTHALENTGIELAEVVHDLDEWLRQGGFLPRVWDTSGDNARRKHTTDKEAP